MTTFILPPAPASVSYLAEVLDYDREVEEGDTLPPSAPATEPVAAQLAQLDADDYPW